MISAVIFDLDGTLVDHLGAQAGALDAGLARLALPIKPADRDHILAQWRDLERRHMDAYLAGECSFTEQRRRRLAAFLPAVGGRVLDERKDEGWWRRYGADYAAAWTAYADVAPCIAGLRALDPRPRLGLLTNGDGGQQRAKLVRIGVLESLDGVFVSSEIGVAKPDPRSFLAACRGLGVEPAEAVFVGDWLEVDALAATDAGLIGVWLDRNDDPRSPPCPRITTLAELRRVLAR